jgi:hypothetical protein
MQIQGKKRPGFFSSHAKIENKHLQNIEIWGKKLHENLPANFKV